SWTPNRGIEAGHGCLSTSTPILPISLWRVPVRKYAAAGASAPRTPQRKVARSMNATTENPSAGDEDATELLTPAEVAEMVHVDPKTVTRWAQAGKLTYLRTLGGHRRYRRDEGLELRQDSSKDV